MSDRDMREKYGGKLPKAINRAIRAEVPGGNEALDKLTQLAGAARHSRWTDHAGRETPEAAAYYKHKREVVDRMEAEVRRRWGVGPDDGRPPRARRGANPQSHGGAKRRGGGGGRSAGGARPGSGGRAETRSGGGKGARGGSTARHASPADSRRGGGARQGRRD